MTPPAPKPPVLQVIRGDATAEEIAALLAVITAGRGDAGPEPARATVNAWTDRAALLRVPVHPGPGAWTASAWPR